ncbi:hypothetical protein [Streptomyces sp. WMMC1477]|uniref:hypothetical protein n=1 Tax=Streptomyces sp. WMMC1477 TaxID=3015155 RepID=UPI0022B63807|nr:hypothetical protein [Streptomyces sp. WMMC1477]MCZ7430588.1 hypothetical protein [Streptomyces sp. WMMC1477]
MALGGAGAPPPAEPFLDPWVFTVVYAGFSLQALALGGLFAGYVMSRWGELPRGPHGLGSPIRPRGRRSHAWLTAALAAVPFLGNLLHGLGLRAAGSDGGLSVVSLVLASLAACAAAGVLAPVLRPRPGRRRAPALVALWCGGSSLAAWGLWWLVVPLIGLAGAPASGAGPSAVRWLTYAAQVIVGFLTLAGLPRAVSSAPVGHCVPRRPVTC